MKERILELQEKAAMAEVEIERLRQRLAEMESRLGDTDTRGVVDSGAVVDSGDEAEPRPQEPYRPLSIPAPAVVEESDLEIEPTAAGEASSGAVGEAPSGAVDGETPAVAEPPAALQPVEPAAQALYDRGYTLYHQGRYLDAEASFQRFIQAYPSTELSDNAQFWIGESRYARDDVRGALAAFRETQQRYPEGNKVPDALIKEGDCLAKLGDKDGARTRYEDVKRRFPSSAAAVMAEERLSGLD